MEKTIRCTVCPWRGTWQDAASVRVRPSDIPPSVQEIQQAYEQKQQDEEQLGGHHPPPCPVCGHHTVVAKLHRSHAAT
jgi:hypothetical protein